MLDIQSYSDSLQSSARTYVGGTGARHCGQGVHFSGQHTLKMNCCTQIRDYIRD